MGIKQLLSAFVVGSSWLIFVTFFRIFYRYEENQKFSANNCIQRIFNVTPYYFYTLVAPFYFGVMSIFGVILKKYLDISIYSAFVLVALLSSLVISIAITRCDLYTFSPVRLREQYFSVLQIHSFFFVVVIANLLRFLSF